MKSSILDCSRRSGICEECDDVPLLGSKDTVVLLESETLNPCESLSDKIPEPRTDDNSESVGIIIGTKLLYFTPFVINGQSKN